MENPNFIFTSSPIELKQEKDDFFVEGYISTSDLDLVNDIVTKECIMDMAEQMKSRVIKLDIEHESFRGNNEVEMEINKTIIPAAKIDNFLIDQKGLKVRAVLNKHASRFKEVMGSIKDGFLDAFSIAFIPTKARMIEKAGQEVRMLDKINLLNVAFTGNPVNTHSTMTNVFAKSLEFLKEQDHIHESDNKLNKQEVKKMSEEEKKATEETSESEEDKAKKKPKEDEEDEDEEMEKKKYAKKSDDSELKSEIESLKKEMMEVKAVLKKPVLKSTVEQQDKSENFVEEKSLNPLDIIA